MHIRVRPRAAAVIALAASSALVLAGCTAAADAGAGESAGKPAAATAAAPKAGQNGKGAPLTRDAVDEEVRSALRTAGLDPEKGKATNAEAAGTKNASLVDWTAVVSTQQADWALPRFGQQLEHLGWTSHPVGTSTLSYEKTDWVLLVGSVKQADGIVLRTGESLLTVNVTYLGAG
ncbi:hypothetical protein [Streptomyces sp. NPDC091268]|uniref:hypothetical protein n=1 Tax=Streptomyces sp. NPDC091268 TaxID=3365979 RepID=UPI0038231F1B